MHNCNSVLLLMVFKIFSTQHLQAAARAYLSSKVPVDMYTAVEERVKTALGGVEDDAFVLELAFVWPALCKMKLRDEKYRMARESAFTTAVSGVAYEAVDNTDTSQCQVSLHTRATCYYISYS